MKSRLIGLLALCLFGLGACGVKGKPLPPLTAPVLGRGEPNYSKATENVKLKKKNIPSDWTEEEDFFEDKEK